MSNEAKVEVLVVEDDPGLRRLYSVTFNQEGFKDPRYDIVMFPNGEEAFVYFKENATRVSVVLSDFDLGKDRMNGAAFLRKVIQEGAKYDPPLDPYRILASSHAGGLSKRDVAAVNSELPKPLRPSALIGAVNAVMDRRG